jgi:hypothetical protein
MPWAIIRGIEKLFHCGKVALDIPGRELSNTSEIIFATSASTLMFSLKHP